MKILLELNDVFDFEEFEIVLINDNSPDITECLIYKNLKKFKKFKYICLQNNLGEDTAINIGLNYAIYENVLIMDDDYQHAPSECKKLYGKLKNTNADVVYSNYAIKHHSKIRNFFSKIFNYVYLLNFKKKLSYISSFKILKKKVIDEFLLTGNVNEIFIDQFILVKNFEIETIDLDHKKREYGGSSYTTAKLLKTFLKKITSRYLI